MYGPSFTESNLYATVAVHLYACHQYGEQAEQQLDQRTCDVLVIYQYISLFFVSQSGSPISLALFVAVFLCCSFQFT